MTVPLDAALAGATSAVALSPAPHPSDAAAVAELLAGIASARRVLLRTFWTMAAASLWLGTRSARPAIAGEAALP